MWHAWCRVATPRRGPTRWLSSRTIGTGLHRPSTDCRTWQVQLLQVRKLR
ncbi:unnamed protein product [Symbiodinium microadriaticum]|nr:unnamed protein product [Symbiodinium microadriaticum]